MVLVESSDFVVRSSALPLHCPAATIMDNDDRANIYINPDAPNPLEKLRHELSHVLRHDFSRHDIREIESESALVEICPVDDDYVIVKEGNDEDRDC